MVTVRSPYSEWHNSHWSQQTRPIVKARLPRRLVLLALIVCSLPAVIVHPLTADSKAAPPLRVGFRHGPPYLIVQADGTPAGLAYDVIGEAARRARIPLEWRATTKLNFQMLDDGEADLWPLADPLDSHGYPVTRPWLRDSFDLVTIATVSAPPKTVAVSSNFRTREILGRSMPSAAVKTVAGAAAAFDAVCAGNADAAFANSRYTRELVLIRTPLCFGVPLRVSTVQGAVIPLGIEFHERARKASVQLRDQIDSMARDGSLAEAFSRWALFSYNDIESQAQLLQSESRQQRILDMLLAASALLTAAGAALTFLHRARRSALQASASKSRFLAIASHELRTPLNGVLGMADLLMATPLNPEQRDIARTIQSSAHSFRQIVSDILEFSRIGASKLELDPSPMCPNQTASEVIGTFAHDAAAKSIDLRADLDQRLGLVLADPGRLRQVIANLAGNAVKFTHTGGVTVRTRLIAESDGLSVFDIEVADTGIGIDPPRIAGLFEPFQQLESSDARRFGGLGLGLAIAKGIVDRMGGSISLESSPGQGTRAHVRLSLPTAPPPPPPIAPAEPPGPMHVLVVDDNQVNGHVATRLLAKLGHTSEFVLSGLEATQAVRRTQFDLILMDCQMPEMDGFEATRQIRGAGFQLPILAMTASVLPSDRQLCLAAGMNGFVTKPVSLTELYAALAAHAPRTNRDVTAPRPPAG